MLDEVIDEMIEDFKQLIIDFVEFMCLPIDFFIDLMKGAEE